MTKKLNAENQLSLATLDSKVRWAIRKISPVGQKFARPVYVVGGIVRDWLLGKPTMDLDVVSEGPVFDLAEAFARSSQGRLVLYKQFMTATVVCPNGLSVDFATARQEIYPQPGVLPRVQEGSLREDLFRRDFTINALAVRLEKGRPQELVDYYGGLADLSERRIRVLHGQSFRDDPTRILRAVRFEQRLGFRLEKNTADLLQEAIVQGYPRYVNAGRYFNEFRKVFSEPAWPRCLKRMKDRQVLEDIFPGLELDMTLLTRLERNKATREESSDPVGNGQTMGLMGMMVKYPVRSRARILSRLPFTREERKAVLATEKAWAVMAQLCQKNLKPSQIYQILSLLDMEIISFIRAATSDKIVVNYIDQYWQRMSRQTLSLTGRDVLAINPDVPGQEVGRILRHIHLEKLDGVVASRRDEVRLARVLLGGKKERQG